VKTSECPNEFRKEELTIPTLSVAIPTYNGEDTILEAIRSVDQEGIDEIVISDNCSTDNTETIIKNLHNDKIKYFRNDQNLGFDQNCDLAVKRVTGDYVWLFSDDDVIQPGAAKKVLAVLMKYPQLAAISVNHSIHDYALKQVVTERYNPNATDMLMTGIDEFLKTTWKSQSLISTNIIRKDLWIQHDSSCFFGNFYIHVSKVFGIVSDRMSYYIAEPLVLNRSGDQRRPWTPQRLISDDLHLIKRLYLSGALGSTIRHCTNISVRGIPRKIIITKRMNFPLEKNQMPSFIRYYGSSLFFWIICIPMFLLPPTVYHIGARVQNWLGIKI
jgi:glycosyltransferase involved in cell wall biosynthesis